MVSARTWMGSGRRGSSRWGKPQRIATTLRFCVSLSHTITGRSFITRKTISRSLPPPIATPVSASMIRVVSAHEAWAANFPHMNRSVAARSYTEGAGRCGDGSSDRRAFGGGEGRVGDVAGVEHVGEFEAENLRLFVGAGAMLDPMRHHDAFAGIQ